jgi:hypothetical protein
VEPPVAAASGWVGGDTEAREEADEGMAAGVEEPAKVAASMAGKVEGTVALVATEDMEAAAEMASQVETAERTEAMEVMEVVAEDTATVEVVAVATAARCMVHASTLQS